MHFLWWRLRMRLHQAWRRWCYPPVVIIEHYGQATPTPKVHVSVCGVNGAQGVYTWDADEVGEARAEMYGKGLAEIMQRRLIDRREKLQKDPQ